MEKNSRAWIAFVVIALGSQAASAAPLARLTPVYRAAKLLPTGFASDGTKSMHDVISKVKAEISIADDLQLSPSERKTLDAYKAATEKFSEASSALDSMHSMQEFLTSAQREARLEEVTAAMDAGKASLKAADQLYLNDSTQRRARPK